MGWSHEVLCQDQRHSFMHLQPLTNPRQNGKGRCALSAFQITQILGGYRTQKIFLRESFMTTQGLHGQTDRFIEIHQSLPKQSWHWTQA